MTAWFTYMVEIIEEVVLYNTCLLISCQLPQCLAEGVLKIKKNRIHSAPVPGLS